jgi:hypothetical protein
MNEQKTRNGNHSDETNKHGNTKHSNNENNFSTTNKRPQNISTFHRNDQTIRNALRHKARKLARIRASPAKRSLKPHHRMESGTVELPINGEKKTNI